MPDEMIGTTGVPDSMGTFYPWWLLLVQGIFALILGIALLAYPLQTLLVIITFLGVYWLVSGLFTLVGLAVDRTHAGMKLLIGLLGIILGLLILAYPVYSTLLVPFVFTVTMGFLALVYGIIAVYGAFSVRAWGPAILGVLSIIFGLLILAEPVAATVILPFVFGIFGLVFGFAAIVGAFMARSAEKSA